MKLIFDMAAEVIKAVFAFINQTLINKTTASSAVGSGSVIIVLFGSLKSDIKSVDEKVDLKEKEVLEYVNIRHREVTTLVEHSFQMIQKDQKYTNDSLNILAGHIKTLDQRVYDSRQKKEK